MDCIETYIEKYAVRIAGSLVCGTTSFEPIAKRIATPTIRTNVHIVCIVNSVSSVESSNVIDFFSLPKVIPERPAETRLSALPEHLGLGTSRLV